MFIQEAEYDKVFNLGYRACVMGAFRQENPYIPLIEFGLGYTIKYQLVKIWDEGWMTAYSDARN